MVNAAAASRLQSTCRRLLHQKPSRCANYTVGSRNLGSDGGNFCLKPISQVRSFSDAADGPKQKQVKAKKKVKSSGKDTESQRSKELNIIMAALDAPVRKEPPISEEEKAHRFQIGRNYTIGRLRQHNENEHDLTCKIRMKQHAINMLPRGSKLKEEALEESEEMPPRWRNIPVWTAPIPGFDPSEFKDRDLDY